MQDRYENYEEPKNIKGLWTASPVMALERLQVTRRSLVLAFASCPTYYRNNNVKMMEGRV